MPAPRSRSSKSCAPSGWSWMASSWRASRRSIPPAARPRSWLRAGTPRCSSGRPARRCRCRRASSPPRCSGSTAPARRRSVMETLQELATVGAHVRRVMQNVADRFRLATAGSELSMFTMDRDLRYTWMEAPSVGIRGPYIVGRTDAEILPAGLRRAAHRAQAAGDRARRDRRRGDRRSARTTTGSRCSRCETPAGAITGLAGQATKVTGTQARRARARAPRGRRRAGRGRDHLGGRGTDGSCTGTPAPSGSSDRPRRRWRSA